ncbi:MAG: DUF1810 domain-containing protein [Xylophilus ampelinus]
MTTASPSSPPPPPGLERFVEAQARAYGAARAEIAAGDKRSHWMWFVFPQLVQLGRSATARHFGLSGADEARAYLRHPVLGPRLRECCTLLLAVRGRSLQRIFGSPDDLKLRSCMTLFEAAAPEEPLFAAVLDRYCGGVRDPLTLAALGPR